MWVLVMTHIASWPVAQDVPPSDMDTVRWNTAIIRKGQQSAAAKKKGKGPGPQVTTIWDYLETVGDIFVYG